MRINPTQKTTKLGTDVTFTVHDLRGVRGFPKDQRGLAFRHQERRVILCKVTGIEIRRHADYIVRTDDTGKGWRIDHMEGHGINTAVYGTNREDYFPSNHEAAKALQKHLDDIRDNSTITGRG